MIDHPTAKQIVEIILPSGVFASMRKPTLADLILCHRVADDSLQLMAVLASKCVMLDGEYRGLDEWLRLPTDDCLAAFGKLSEIAFGVKRDE